jgi:hypothetical protein
LRRILLIARRDYLATIRTKAFLVGLVVAPVLFGGGFLGIALLKSKPDIKDRPVAIIDRTGMVASAVIQAAQEKNAMELFDKVTHRQIAARYVFESLAPARLVGPGAPRSTLRVPRDRPRRPASARSAPSEPPE